MKEKASTKTYTEHPISNMFPVLPENELNELADDIKANGLKQPIVIYQGKILDGRNRYEACKTADVQPAFTEYTGSNATSYVLSLNLQRRHLTPSQKAAVAVEALPHLEKEAKQRQKQHRDTAPGKKQNTGGKNSTSDAGKARDIAARALKVNSRYVQDAKKLKEDRPELFEKVKQGEIDITKAKNVIYRETESKLKDTSNVSIKNTERCTLHNCDILDAPVEDNSVDVIITDPPYPREFLDCWKKLAQFAVKKLKKNGVLIAASGHAYLPEVFRNMTVDGLNYYWTGCLYQPKVSADLHTKRLRTHWKPFLIYVKGDYTRTFQATDVYSSSYEDAKEGQKFHKWGQSYQIFEQFVKDYTYAGEVVCDPFLGGGTTAIAAITHKRKFIGIELNKETFNVAGNRINQITNN
jgi:ParB-like chromosome segregation protein Spo0J